MLSSGRKGREELGASGKCVLRTPGLRLIFRVTKLTIILPPVS
uniref:Uncharacterized protein n=1 Tax=Anguilla anguilla TaxID=7936 RepID=A0A0E9WIG3_ANGAN